jgi:hypothetical protein
MVGDLIMTMPDIKSFATVDDVTNIYLFIADSVRERATSESITSLGISGRAVAASTYTGSSYPSIITGQYPATHCVWGFDDSLSNRPALLSGPEVFGLNAETMWTDLPSIEKPLFKMVRATSAEAMPLIGLNPLFTAVEHHKGGHLPYGYSLAEYHTPEFFKQVRPSLEDIPALYQRSVRTAEERFLEAVETLNDRGLLEETLVIYTSDHGENLGEKKNGAAIGHGDPVSSDLVYVPIVFTGAGLPDESLDVCLSGVDVAPTALSALGRRTCNHDGQDCWTELPTNRLLRSERWVHGDVPMLGTTETFKSTSVWDSNGGIVFHRGNLWSRVALAVQTQYIQTPWGYLNRSHPYRWLASLQKYGPGCIYHGNPGFNEEEAASMIKPFQKTNATGEDEEIDSKQLRKLGYMN